MKEFVPVEKYMEFSEDKLAQPLWLLMWIALGIAFLLFLAIILDIMSKGFKGGLRSEKVIWFIFFSAIFTPLCVISLTSYEDYKGRFEIVESNATTTTSKSANIDTLSGAIDTHRVVLKDKQGNKQSFIVEHKDGIFRKGKYAQVIVKAEKGSDKPTLSKPLDKGSYKVKQIEQK